MSNKICDWQATLKVTGLIGMEAKMTKRLYSSFETVEMDPLASRFVTFELDLTGD